MQAWIPALRPRFAIASKDGAALAIHQTATVEDFEILRRIGIVSVKVWLLRRRRLAQGFLSHLCLNIRAHILEDEMKIVAFCMCCLLILSAPGVMAQQSTTPNQSATVPNQSWDLLRQLQAGEKVQVETKTGKKKPSGNFVSLSDTELVIRRGKKLDSFSRDEVKNIWRKVSPSRKKRVILTSAGGGAGFFLGGLMALEILFSQDGSEAGAGAALIGITAGGALVGYAMAGRTKRTLIYSAP